MPRVSKASKATTSSGRIGKRAKIARNTTVVTTARPSKWSTSDDQTLIYNNFFSKDNITHKQTAAQLGRSNTAVRIELCRIKKQPKLLQPLFEYWWDQHFHHTHDLPAGVRAKEPARDPATIEAANNLLFFAEKARKHYLATPSKPREVIQERSVSPKREQHRPYIFLTPRPYREFNPESFNDQGIQRVRDERAKEYREASETSETFEPRFRSFPEALPVPTA